ncbi:MAG: hypothetical protein IPJ01_10385 [Micavibrio sp.]|nr:hypothetical protein [Micavibrio sp.]
MIPSKISFETGFGKSGLEYGEIQAWGDIRNVLSALITYYKDINSVGVLQSHHGFTINLNNYDLKLRVGQFGNIEKSKNNYLGIVFDGGGCWYSDINEHGNSQSKERFLTVSNKIGIMKIIDDTIGNNPFIQKWNHENASTSFSVVLDINVEWKQLEWNSEDFKSEISKMVLKLNSLAKSFSAVTN